jgi:hypothetical protein
MFHCSAVHGGWFMVFNATFNNISLISRSLMYIGNQVVENTGRDRMVVGFTTTYAISAYHH